MPENPKYCVLICLLMPIEKMNLWSLRIPEINSLIKESKRRILKREAELRELIEDKDHVVQMEVVAWEMIMKINKES